MFADSHSIDPIINRMLYDLRQKKVTVASHVKIWYYEFLFSKYLTMKILQQHTDDSLIIKI